jgi:hypothetical protein
MQGEAILSVGGQEILNFGRQSIPTFVPGRRLNSGRFGTLLGCPTSSAQSEYFADGMVEKNL